MTHTDRLLDQSSYNPTSHKSTTNVFSENNYNADYIRWNTYKPAEHNETNANPTPVTTATIPYTKGTSETIVQILKPYNIHVAHKPITTLRQLLTNVEDKDEPNDRQGAIYKINCWTARPLTLVRPAEIYKQTTDRT